MKVLVGPVFTLNNVDVLKGGPLALFKFLRLLVLIKCFVLAAGCAGNRALKGVVFKVHIIYFGRRGLD